MYHYGNDGFTLMRGKRDNIRDMKVGEKREREKDERQERVKE